MAYKLLRHLLFRLPPEQAHKLALEGLSLAYKLGLSALFNANPPSCPRKVMGLHFPNPVGLAAGLDKDGEYVAALASLGFGFIEVGTVTPKPQLGNPKPRLFRLPQQQALINRMGFNSKGLDYFLRNIRRYKGSAILGINLGKNVTTAIADAATDYLIGLDAVYPYADYVTINISSPNTRSLRALQQEKYLDQFLGRLKHRQQQLADLHQRYVPLVIKISPDLVDQEITFIASQLLKHRIDGVIATNTTIRREGIADNAMARQQGGLSGQPLSQVATLVVSKLRQQLQGDIPIIASGGVMSAHDAQQKFDAGAELVQLYTGLIYRGSKLIKEIVRTTAESSH